MSRDHVCGGSMSSDELMDLGRRQMYNTNIEDLARLHSLSIIYWQYVYAKTSQKALTSQLNLSCRLASPESAPGNTDRASFSKFNFFFDVGVRTWAVVREGNAGEGSRAKVVAALCCMDEFRGQSTIPSRNVAGLLHSRVKFSPCAHIFWYRPLSLGTF